VRALRSLLIGLLLIVATAPAAGAHVELLESEPVAGGTVRAGVTSVKLTLLALDPSGPVSIEVTDPAGIEQTVGEPEVDERTSVVSVATEPLQAGEHIVHWHALADDGDGESEGTFTFTVEEAPDRGIGLWLVWIVALAIPAAIFLRPGARRSR
jgi:copper resistance protein C